MIRAPYFPQQHALPGWSTPFIGYVPHIEQPVLRSADPAQAVITGGDGSRGRPFVVEGGAQSGDYVAIEYRKLEELHGRRDVSDPNWMFLGQALSGTADRRYDILTIRLANGRERAYWFDITEPFDSKIHGLAMALKKAICLRPAGDPATFPDVLVATIAGGDGSQQRPFVIRSGPGFDYIELQRRTLARTHGHEGRDWTFLGWASRSAFEHLYEVVTIRKRDGTEIETWFDITEPWFANLRAFSHGVVTPAVTPAGQVWTGAVTTPSSTPSVLDASLRSRPLLFVGVTTGLFAAGYLLGRLRGVLP